LDLNAHVPEGGSTHQEDILGRYHSAQNLYQKQAVMVDFDFTGSKSPLCTMDCRYGL
jgi:hypothetical protein